MKPLTEKFKYKGVSYKIKYKEINTGMYECRCKTNKHVYATLLEKIDKEDRRWLIKSIKEYIDNNTNKEIIKEFRIKGVDELVERASKLKNYLDNEMSSISKFIENEMEVQDIEYIYCVTNKLTREVVRYFKNESDAESFAMKQRISVRISRKEIY